MKITYGADPELMLINCKDRKVVSSIPILKRDKHNPISLNKEAKMYCDNVLVEFAFKPCRSKTEFLSRLQQTFKSAQEYLGKEVKIFPKTVHNFDDTQLQKEHGIDPKEVGCNPSHNAYSLQINEIEPFDSGLRTGSFHIHLGGKELQNVFTKINTIKLMDIFVGCSSIVFTRDKTAKYRRKYYGKAGEFRYTPYGVEYRVLDNFALRSPQLTDLVMDLTNYTLQLVENKKEADLLESIDGIEVQKAINTSNKKLAEDVLIKAKLPKSLMNRVVDNYKISFYKDWQL